MSLNRVILSIALGVSFHGAIMSMENEINEQIKLINLFTKSIIAHNAKEIEPLGDWLTQKRNEIRDDNNWNSLINNLIDSIIINNKDNWKNANKRAICNVIEETVRNLQPGQASSQQIANCFAKAVKRATSEWIKAHDFGIDLI